jgi:ribosome recycling factor
MTTWSHINSLKKAPDQPNRGMLLKYIANYLEQRKPAVEEYREKLNETLEKDVKKIMAEIIGEYEEIEKFYLEATNNTGGER